MNGSSIGYVVKNDSLTIIEKVMDEKVKVSLQIEIPRLSEDVDIDSVREGLNEYVKSII